MRHSTNTVVRRTEAPRANNAALSERRLLREARRENTCAVCSLRKLLLFLTVLVSAAIWQTNALQAEVQYNLHIVSTKDENLDTLIKDNSLLAELIHKPPQTQAGLRRRIKRDKKRLGDLMRSEGYYGAHVSIIQSRGSQKPIKAVPKRRFFSLDPISSRNTSEVFDDLKVDRRKEHAGLLSIRIAPGPAFTYDRFGLKLIGLRPEARDVLKPRLVNLVYRKGARARAEGVLEAERRILGFLADNAYPYAEIADRRVTVDHATNSLSTDLHLNLGPNTSLGSVTLKGLENSNRDFVEERLQLEEGASFSEAELEAAKKRLLNTGLFSTVNIRKPGTAPPFGVAPLVVELAEKKKRQVTLSAGLSVKKGPLASIEWRHRDLFGKAQNLSLKLQANRDQATGNLSFEWPNFYRDDQILTASLKGEFEKIANVETVSVDTSLTLGRWYRNQKAFFTFGPRVEYLQSKSPAADTESYFASLPVAIELDQSNDILDPDKGFRLSGRVAPHINIKDPDQVFTKVEAGTAGYLQLRPDRKLTLAGWIKGGALLGEDLSAIPIQKRFFIGGAGSVRAFSDKEISPTGQTGGIAKLEGGVELRRRIGKNLGAVVFVEGGQVFDNLDMSSNQDIHVGMGFGLRYFTNFGPVRADVAVPIGGDTQWSDVELLVGLGQAF